MIKVHFRYKSVITNDENDLEINAILYFVLTSTTDERKPTVYAAENCQ